MGYEYIKVKQATEQGWIICAVPGCCDLSYPTSKLRRGRVQGGGHVAPTITTSGGGGKGNQMDKKERVIGIIDPKGFIRDNKCYRGGSTYHTS